MPGGRATLYALVPLGASCGGGDWQVADGHSHTDPSEMPSKKLRFLDCIALRLNTTVSTNADGIDPLGGWQDTGQTLTEDNGIVRGIFSKTGEQRSVVAAFSPTVATCVARSLGAGVHSVPHSPPGLGLRLHGGYGLRAGSQIVATRPVVS